MAAILDVLRLMQRRRTQQQGKSRIQAAQEARDIDRRQQLAIELRGHAGQRREAEIPLERQVVQLEVVGDQLLRRHEGLVVASRQLPHGDQRIFALNVRGGVDRQVVRR